jgi:hypothetical protein
MRGFILLLLIYLASGYSNRCPSCKKWFAKKKLGSRIVDQSSNYRTVTRNDIHRDRHGREIGRTERQEQVIVNTNTTRHSYHCKKCGHQWSSLTIKDANY